MREQDRQRFELPYPMQDGHPVGDLGTALSLPLGMLRTLLAEVRNDLDAKTFGIGWWRLGGETPIALQQRILVSDYLIDALQSVESNLVDLSLHFLELQGWWERESEFVRDSVRMGPNGPTVKLPPRLRPADDLVHHFGDLHTTGVFRSVGSVLDCLASVIIGVAAVEMNILRGDWSSLVDRHFAKLVDNGTTGRALQVALRDDVSTLLTAGRAEWDRWASDFRNMLVHRGQRMKLSALVPESYIVDAAGTPVVRAMAINLLPRDPELSEAEAFALGAKVAPVLTEDAHVTITGMVKDLSALVDGVAAALLPLWKKRREAPSILVQPVAKQWPSIRRASHRNFAGYQPGQTPYQPDAMTINPEFMRRLRAASLDSRDAAKTWT